MKKRQYVAYELERQHEHSSSSFARSFNSAVHQIVQGAGGVSQYGKKHNSNPFNGAVSEDVVVVDEAGNAIEPHAHVPGVTNPDGTPWLPIRK